MSLNRKEIEKLLKKEEICYIATTRADGRPHLAPIWFIYHSGKIYFETDNNTVKFKNIKHNNKVALCFGGRATYVVEGSVKWFKEKELDFSIRELYWEKYKYNMDDTYINDKTLIFEVIIEKEISWHYADQGWE